MSLAYPSGEEGVIYGLNGRGRGSRPCGIGMGEACLSAGGVGYVKLLVGAGWVVDKYRLSHGRRNFKDTNPFMSFSLVILFGGGGG